MRFPNIRELFLTAIKNFGEDRASRLAAAFSFYAMLSLSPMLVLAVAVGTRFLGDSAAGARIVKLAGEYIGKQGAGFLQSMILASAKPSASTIATILSLLVAIYGASSLFQQLSDSVNQIWDAKSEEAGLKGFFVGKAVAVVLFLVFAAVFTAWLAIDSWITWIQVHTPGVQFWELLSFGVSVVFLTLVFALSFRALPKGMVAWGDVWIPGFVTACGFGISKYLLGLYFSYSTVSAAYGTAGAVVILLLWTYYSTQIFFFGIEMTYSYAHMHGSQKNRQKGQPPIPVSDKQQLKDDPKSKVSVR